MPFDTNGSNGNYTNVKDYSSFSNNGTLIKNTTSVFKWNASCGAFAGSGGCYEFNKRDFISIPDAIIDTSKPHTYCYG